MFLKKVMKYWIIYIYLHKCEYSNIKTYTVKIKLRFESKIRQRNFNCFINYYIEHLAAAEQLYRETEDKYDILAQLKKKRRRKRTKIVTSHLRVFIGYIVQIHNV